MIINLKHTKIKKKEQKQNKYIVILSGERLIKVREGKSFYSHLNMNLFKSQFFKTQIYRGTD